MPPGPQWAAWHGESAIVPPALTVKSNFFPPMEPVPVPAQTLFAVQVIVAPSKFIWQLVSNLARASWNSRIFDE
jgi:hypothetical protein